MDRAPKRCTSSLRMNCIINHEDLRRSRKVQLWISRNGWRPPKYKESISAPFLASRASIFLLAGRPLSPASLSRLSCPSLLPFVLRPQESTYGCSFGNHIFFVSQFAAPLNALPPFRRGCISVAAARYKFWLRAFDGVGGKVGQGEKRRRKIGPMVIDYLPRIPRIPYSDRPHGPKIEPSITGAPLSFSSLYHLLLLPFSPPSSLLLPTLPSRSTLSSIFSRRATKDIIPDSRKRCY